MVINKNIDEVIDKFVKDNNLPNTYKNSAKKYLVDLSQIIFDKSKLNNNPLCLGINGAQGTGKSTLSLFIKIFLEKIENLSVEIISIDDLYLTKKERVQLSLDIHKLFITRGVPGTHDVEMGCNFIKSCLKKNYTNLCLPRFDKLIDDRLPKNEWLCIDKKVDVLILEGWCVGAKAQEEKYLVKSINTLEENYDSEGIWRKYSNDQLRESYQSLFELCSFLIMLKAPSFEVIYDWRLKQEMRTKFTSDEKLSRRMNPDEITFFVQHYERLTRWMLDDLPSRADVVIELDNNHIMERIVYK